MTEPKQERAVRTRSAILQAAAEVFDECGFHAASISKIMKRAQVTAGSMYFHFNSKEALAQAVMNGQHTDLQLPDQPQGLRQLIDVTRYLASQLQHNIPFRAGVRLAVEQGEFGIRDDAPYQQWVEQFRQELVAARESGELLPEVDEREFAQVLVGAFSGTQLFSQIATGREDLPRRIESMWWYLLPGIAVPEAHRLLLKSIRRGEGAE
jgi:AcrR family transcriptional regulator